MPEGHAWQAGARFCSCCEVLCPGGHAWAVQSPKLSCRFLASGSEGEGGRGEPARAVAAVPSLATASQFGASGRGWPNLATASQLADGPHAPHPPPPTMLACKGIVQYLASSHCPVSHLFPFSRMAFIPVKQLGAGKDAYMLVALRPRIPGFPFLADSD